MTDEQKQEVRDTMQAIADQAIAHLMVNPLYVDEGEAYSIKVEFTFGSSPNRPWNKDPREHGETYLLVMVETTIRETR